MHLHPFRRWHTKNLSQPFTVYEPMTVQTQIYTRPSCDGRNRQRLTPYTTCYRCTLQPLELQFQFHF